MAKKTKIMIQQSLSALAIAMLLASNVQAAERNPRFNSLLQVGPSVTSWNSAILPLLQTDKQALLFAGQYEHNRLGKHDYNWIGSIGAGYRHMANNQFVWGAYLFGDKVRTNERHDFYVLSPGADLRTEQFSLASNFYIPIGKRRHLSTEFGDQMEIENSVSFNPGEHTAYVQQYGNSEQAMLGADVMLRYYPKHMKYISGGLGAYHYQAKENISQDPKNITGVKAALQLHQGSYLSYSAEYRYDNVYHSRVLFGLELSLARRQHAGDVLVDALTAQIYRNLNINTTHDGVATATTTSSFGDPIPEYENLYLVDSSASPGGDGTYETPYQSLSEALEGVNAAPVDANMWLSGEKKYESYNQTSSDQITLLKGQSISGRSANFQLPTHGTLDGAAQVNTKKGILLSNGSALNGFYLTAINNQADIQGVKLNSGDSATLQSMMIDTTSGASFYAYGIFNTGTLTISGQGDNHISATSTSGRTYGILNDTPTAVFTISNIGSNKFAARSKDGRAIGIYNYDADISISNTDNNEISAESDSHHGWGIFNNNKASFTISNTGNNTISGKSTTQSAIGISNTDNADFNFNTPNFINTMSATSDSGLAIPIDHNSTVTATPDTTLICIANGSTLPSCL